MEAHLPPHYLAFHWGTGNYQRARWGIRKVFAEEIWKKYVQINATHPVRGLSKEILQSVRDELTTGKPSPDTYTASREFVGKHIERVFKEKFVPSPSFQNYLKSLELPDSRYKSFKKRYATKYATGLSP